MAYGGLAGGTDGRTDGGEAWLMADGQAKTVQSSILACSCNSNFLLVCNNNGCKSSSFYMYVLLHELS